MKFIYLIIVGLYFAASYASNPSGYDFASYNIGYDSIEIDDKSIPDCFDSIPHITVHLSLPLVDFKDKMVTDKLKQLLSGPAGEYKYIILYQKKLSRKSKFFQAMVMDNYFYRKGLDKSTIGYTLIDSTFIIMDESVKPCLKIDKCTNKDFQIEIGNPACKPLFNYDNFFYFNVDY